MLYLHMENEEVQRNSLNKQQLKQHTVKVVAEKLDGFIEEWEIQNNITEKDYEELSKQHFRSTSK